MLTRLNPPQSSIFFTKNTYTVIAYGIGPMPTRQWRPPHKSWPHPQEASNLLCVSTLICCASSDLLLRIRQSAATRHGHRSASKCHRFATRCHRSIFCCSRPSNRPEVLPTDLYSATLSLQPELTDSSFSPLKHRVFFVEAFFCWWYIWLINSKFDN